MKIDKLLLTGIVSGALALSSFARAGELKGEKVDLKSLSEAVQKTIKDKSAGGKVVRVKREDDTNGKWNYEVVVSSDGKEWGFEVDPNGKYVKQHDDLSKRE